MHSGNKAQIPGPSLEGDELGDGPGNDAPQGPSSQVERGVEPDDPARLGKPGLLGEAIIPLSEPDAPHAQRLQRPPSPNPIKVATPEASRAPTSPGLVPLESSRDPAPSNMIFSDLVKSPRTTFTKFRNSFPHGVQPPLDFDPDLVSRDKVKNREAVNRYLAERVRNDWEFTWPPVVNSASASAGPAASAQDENAQTANGDAQEAGDGAAAAVEDAPRDPGAEADSESDAESVYSTISEDTTRFRPRAEWTSDLSDDDEPCPSASPFRFDSPDAVGAAVRESIETKRARRRRAVREEMKWNPGLACFEARRNAWTGAKTVRVKPKPPSPVSPSSARRFFWRHHRTQSSISHSAVVASGSPPGPSSPLSPTATRTSTTTASDSDSGAVQKTVSRDSTVPRVLHPVQTVVPVAPPLLPPQNPMRASVQPAMYSSLYDKVVTQSLQPACPVNLSDMLRACVVGWKRDGEWPPKSVYPAPASVEASNAQVLAVRQHKAQQQRNKDAAAAEAAASKGRRLSLVGLFGTGGGTGGGNKTASRTTTTPAATQEANGANNKESKEDELRRSQSNSHTDDVAGSSGKTLFRRSLQRVLSLGQHGHAHGAAGGNGVEGPFSPTSPTTKEVTAAT